LKDKSRAVVYGGIEREIYFISRCWSRRNKLIARKRNSYCARCRMGKWKGESGALNGLKVSLGGCIIGCTRLLELENKNRDLRKKKHGILKGAALAESMLAGGMAGTEWTVRKDRA